MEKYNKLIEKIKKLKKEKNAVCLVHNYQRPEIYEIADHIGDSLGLSQAAVRTNASIIEFCGVDFMAESAKILNPDKKVLIPTKAANCPMAAMVTSESLKEMKKKFPDTAVVCYVNTSAVVKAESDVCCTSANAAKVVNSLSNKQIIFVPDQHLANYVQTKTDKEIIKWKGYCYVHAKIKPEDIMRAKESHPNAKVIAHPECPLEVLKLADHVTSTSGMVKYARNPFKEFIIATEEGMVNRLHKEFSDKKFYPVGGVCFNMKAITLEKVYESLKKEQFEITLPEEIIKKAKKALDRMIKIGRE